MNRHRLAERVPIANGGTSCAGAAEHRQARAEAEKANEAKSTFPLPPRAAEIRTPLYGILGTVQLLADKPLMANYRDDLQAINGSGGRYWRFLTIFLITRR